MTKLPEGWNEYDPNNERSNLSSYQNSRADAASRAHQRRTAYGEALAALRRARSLTQVAVAQRLGVAQGEVSRIEHQADLLLSTLTRFIEGMDGQLSLLVRFGDGHTVELSAMLDALLAEVHSDDESAVPDLATVIELAGYHGRYQYKENEFRAIATA